MYQHSANTDFEKTLDELSLKLHNIRSPTERFKFLNTFCQVVNNGVTRAFVEKGEMEAAREYISKFIPEVPVPLHYEFLTKLGLLVNENNEKVTIISKADRSSVIDIKNDPICSGSESLKLALIMLASEYDDTVYRVDFTMANRKILFNEYVRNHNLDLTYDDYVEGLSDKKYDDLKLVEVRDDDTLEIAVDHINFDCKTSELLTSDEVFEILGQLKEKCVVFQCRMKASDSFSYPGFKIEQINNTTRRFVPIKEMLFAPGPEHAQHINKLMNLLRQFGRPKGKMFEYKPCTVKNMMSAKKREAGYLDCDFSKKNNAEDSQNVILDIISGDKKILGKYIELRELFETHRELIQSNDRLREYLTDFQGPPAWRKKVTDMRQSCGGKTFNQVVIGGARALKEFLTGVAYKQAVASGRKGPLDMSLRECFDAFMDTMIRSPAHFPEMARVGNLYRFAPGVLENNFIPKFNPKKDPLQMNIDAGIVDPMGKTADTNLDDLMERLSNMNSSSSMNLLEGSISAGYEDEIAVAKFDDDSDNDTPDYIENEGDDEEVGEEENNGENL